MADLIELKEAARMLGMSPEELNDLRSQREIHGYRDGSTWKFKQSEIDRLAAKRAEEGAASSSGAFGADWGIETIDVDEDLSPEASDDKVEEPAEDLQFEDFADLTADDKAAESGDSGVDADLEEMVEVSDLDDMFDPDSILVSEVELGGSDVGTASTIIGRGDRPSTEDSDIQLASEPAEEGGSKGSDVLAGEAELVPDDSSASGIRLAASSDVLAGSDVGVAGGGAPGDTADLAPGQSDDLSLETEPLELDDDLSLGSLDEFQFASDSTVDPSAGVKAEDDDALVLDTGTGSDVTLSGDSGINLSSPIDSGLSLEEPLDLTGSGSESLELGEAEVQLEEAADSEIATQLKADDDFLLTPVEGSDADEADTGSQVIALDTEEFDESAATMLHSADSPLLADADLIQEAEEGELDEEAMVGPSPLVPQSALVPEAKYPAWGVGALFIIVILLSITGIMMADLVRNVWSFHEPNVVSSTLMDWMSSFTK